MRFIKHLKSDWFRYGFETLAVVVGILVAFALDNWGENRRQERIETDYLTALKSEFEQNFHLAENIAKTYTDLLTAAGDLLKYTGANHALLSEQECSMLLANSLMNAYKYVSSPGILQDLINSGNLSKISNPHLRALLSEWFIILNNASRTEEEAFQHRSELLDLQIQHTPFVNIGRDIGYQNLVEEYPDQSNFPGDIRDILLIREFEGRMAIYAATLWALGANSYVEIIDHCEKILNVIDLELK